VWAREVAITVLLASALTSGAARGQPAADEAQAHFERGAALAAEQKYEEAAAEFKASYEQRPRKESLFAWAQVLRLAGDCPGAVELYRKFLRSPELTQTQIEAAQLGIDRCETAPAPKPVPPPPAPAPPPPPVATVTAPPPPPVVSAQRSRGAMVAGATLLGGSVLALGASGTFYLLSRDAEKQALAAETWGAYREPAGRARTQQRWALGFLGAGVLLGAGAVLEWLATAPRGTTGTAWIGSGGAGVGLRGTY
jgi:tetratricopeptide (TPR) repeat protein